MKTSKHVGICRLTGKSGPYVDSHLIPLALTRLSEKGAKHVEAGIGLGVKHRSSSWYDNRLVTRDGEDVLAEIDARGIEDLRRYKLIWSGWWPGLPLEADDLVIDEGKPVWRLVQLEAPERLQLFFLSLLWRAAASARPEFADIELPANALENLRERICRREVGRAADYPVQLFQVITPGVRHNRAPLLERKATFRLDGKQGPEVEYVRFYFDGLVAHVHLALGLELAREYLNTCLGFQERAIVFVHEYEYSRTADNMDEMLRTVWREYLTPTVPKSTIARAVNFLWPPAQSDHVS